MLKTGWHVLFGGIFTFVFWLVVPSTPYFSLAILFLSSFLIDLDHSVSKFFKKGNAVKELHLFHAVEFQVLIAILSFWFPTMFFVFVGMVFHSLIDIIYVASSDKLVSREFFFFSWFRKAVF